MVRTNAALVIAIAATLLGAAAEAAGTAVVQVRTSPDFGEGTFRFTGTPAGQLPLADVDPMIVAAGYTLTQIRCDDKESAEPSTGEVQDRSATFRIEGAETVTCVFEFSVPEEIEASIEMHRVPDCGYKGSVGGSRDGIPMTIEFTWEVHTSERITGDLQSTFSKDGMTCEMSRDYELTFGR